jgi:Helix-turn-helix domain
MPDRNLTLVAGLVARLVEVAVERPELLAEIGIDPVSLDDHDNPLPLEVFARQWKQRRLHAEGTTFNGLLDESRRTLGESYLADRKLAAYEVSSLLGYAEPATFFRAFKRWTGKTPQEFRASL